MHNHPCRHRREAGPDVGRAVHRHEAVEAEADAAEETAWLAVTRVAPGTPPRSQQGPRDGFPGIGRERNAVHGDGDGGAALNLG